MRKPKKPQKVIRYHNISLMEDKEDIIDKWLCYLQGGEMKSLVCCMVVHHKKKVF